MYLILALSLTIAIGYSVWNTYFRAQPINIMAIEQVPLSYGDTTLTGTLQKDSPAGVDGHFILALPDMRVVELGVQGVDSLIGFTVSVSGVLSPSVASAAPLTMTVNTISVAQ